MTTRYPATTSAASGPEAARNLELVAEGKLTACTDVPRPPFELEEGGQLAGNRVGQLPVTALHVVGGEHLDHGRPGAGEGHGNATEEGKC